MWVNSGILSRCVTTGGRGGLFGSMDERWVLDEGKEREGGVWFQINNNISDFQRTYLVSLFALLFG